MTTQTRNASHAIIAGVNKCGTTSVFRYLSDHPEICASSIKETHFFVRDFDDNAPPAYNDYLTYFGHCSNEQVLLEASPTYFSSGRQVADRIDGMLPGSRIIVILRNPIDRFFSYYRSALVYDNFQTELLEGLSFGQVVDMAIESYRSGAGGDARKKEFAKALQQGCYADHIRAFAAQFSPERLSFFFFEDLVDAPAKVMQDVCRFLGVDAKYFENYEFRVENKTRTYRSMGLQKLVFRANMQFEGLLNRFPGARKAAQNIYRAINERKQIDAPEMEPGSREKLYEFYYENIIELRALLADTFGVEKFPRWIVNLESSGRTK